MAKRGRPRKKTKKILRGIKFKKGVKREHALKLLKLMRSTGRGKGRPSDALKQAFSEAVEVKRYKLLRPGSSFSGSKKVSPKQRGYILQSVNHRKKAARTSGKISLGHKKIASIYLDMAS